MWEYTINTRVCMCVYLTNRQRVRVPYNELHGVNLISIMCIIYFSENGIVEVENIVVLVASVVSLISFLTLCSWCWRSKPGSGKSESDEDAIENFRQSNPNASQQRQSLLFGTLPTSDDGLSKSTVSPGHGRRTIRFPNPPEVGVDVMAIQPEKDTEVLIPPEPQLPDPGRDEYLGQIFFSLKYDSQTMTLALKIMKATKLPAKDFSGTSDPFVKITLLPDKKHKMETRVKRRNLNPVWNEYFTFEGFPYNKLMQRTLLLQVLDYDRFSRNDPIGDVRLSLENLNLGPEPIMLSKELKPSSKAVS